MTEKFFNTLEVAELLKISDRTVRTLCSNGEIEFYRIGTQIRISETHLNNYLSKSLNTEKEIIENDREHESN